MKSYSDITLKYLNKNNLFYLTTHAGMFVAGKRKNEDNW